MKKKKHICPTCGASAMEHRHSLSKGLLVVLRALCEARRPVRLSDLSLTRGQIDNAQKLRYWNLTEKYRPPERPDAQKLGIWTITHLGLEFMSGRRAVPKCAWTFRGETIKFEGPDVYVQEIFDGWKYRPDYGGDSRPHHEVAQTPDKTQLTMW